VVVVVVLMPVVVQKTAEEVAEQERMRSKRCAGSAVCFSLVWVSDRQTAVIRIVRPAASSRKPTSNVRSLSLSLSLSLISAHIVLQARLRCVKPTVRPSVPARAYPHAPPPLPIPTHLYQTPLTANQPVQHQRA
jgi:hypothetical protein